MSVSVLNTDSGLSGKTLVNAEDSQTITGLKTFDRDPNAPFAVSAGSAKVDNLDADKLDGDDWTSGVDQIQAGAGSVSAPTYSKNGDSNSGVYFPAADEVALATGGTQALLVDSTQFIDSPTQPRARVHPSAAQSVADSTTTALTFDTEDFDVGAMHSTSSNTSRLTIPTGGDGTYDIKAGSLFPASATGVRALTIKKNGSTVLAASQVASAGGSLATVLNAACLVELVATDYVEAYVFQSSGSAMSVGGSTGYTFLSAVKLW